MQGIPDKQLIDQVALHASVAAWIEHGKGKIANDNRLLIEQLRASLELERTKTGAERAVRAGGASKKRRGRHG
jgi:hypothetical protein